MTPILALLAGRQRLSALPSAERERVLRVADRHGLLARLWLEAVQTGDIEALPPRTRARLDQSRFRPEAAAALIRRECGVLAEQLAGLEAPVILLKGAAYELAGDPAGRGRLSADIDILIPKQHLSAAEAALRQAGWRFRAEKAGPADQHYYRAWMHELPPMLHSQRAVELDVHHSLLPPVGRLKVAIAPMIAAAQPVADGRLAVFQPMDRLLHACAHLFFDGAFERALRNLIEIADMLVWQAQAPDFWPRFTARAVEVNLALPAWHGVRMGRDLFGLEVPAEAVQRLAQAAGPGAGTGASLVHTLFRMRLAGDTRRPDGSFSASLAANLLFLRSHLIKMPLPLLIRYSLGKAARGIRRA